MSPTRPVPERVRRARRAAVACVSAVVLLVSCGGGTDGEPEQAPGPAPAEVAADPTPQPPPDVGEAGSEGGPAVAGESEGVGPDPQAQDG